MSDHGDSTPLHHQQPFGAGIRRTRVNFVPAAELVSPSPSSSSPCHARPTASELYLSVVFKGAAPCPSAPVGALDSVSSLSTQPAPQSNTAYEAEHGSLQSLNQQTCQICHLPISSTLQKPHEASLAHQVCLEHSYPPSHLDRNRYGLRYLSSAGWDPDSRQGLGARGEGITAPIKRVEKNNTVGLGVDIKKRATLTKSKEVGLDAGKIRKQHADGKRKIEKLRELFYGRDDVQRYLRES